MIEKQKILTRHIQGQSNREIARELHISKNTVNKYVAEYDRLHHALLDENPKMDEDEIISAFAERPKYIFEPSLCAVSRYHSCQYDFFIDICDTNFD